MDMDQQQKTHLEKLDNIQHQALRICTRAFKTTPTAAVKVEMGEMSLLLRRTQLTINIGFICKEISQIIQC